MNQVYKSCRSSTRIQKSYNEALSNVPAPCRMTFHFVSRNGNVVFFITSLVSFSLRSPIRIWGIKRTVSQNSFYSELQQGVGDLSEVINQDFWSTANKKWVNLMNIFHNVTSWLGLIFEANGYLDTIYRWFNQCFQWIWVTYEY